MSIDEIDQNSNSNGSSITLSTSVTNNESVNQPTETDLLNDPETAIETTYNVEKEKISQVNRKVTNEDNPQYKSYLFYGNHYQNMEPKYLGRTRAFLYRDGYPKIIIGPDCKLIIII